MTQIQGPDMATTAQRQRQSWSSGDYDRIATTITIVGELLCEAVDLRSGHRVLDVATGSGNTALAAARRFGDVSAIDWVPALLERGREGAAAERLTVTFVEGDAENLPFPDASFDVVLSTFGVMFAPNQERAAIELLRVCRPGGEIGLANWTPDGWVGEKLLRAFPSLDALGRESPARKLVEGLQRYNRSGDETIVVPADYREVVAVRR